MDELIDFLLRAKKATYAGYGVEIAPSRQASHDLEYKEGDFYYYDTYIGGERFAGEEAIWENNKPVLCMNVCFMVDVFKNMTLPKVKGTL